jgi:ATP-binding cassette subfamily A (ABC1) protein 3
MGIQSIIAFTILLFIDYRILSKFWYLIQQIIGCNRRNSNRFGNNTVSALVPTAANIQIASHEDDDVAEEAARIKTRSYHELMETDVLVLNQVEKVYGGAFHAVDQLSLGVKKSECFGLLGVNGA